MSGWRLILVRRPQDPALPQWLLPALVLAAGLMAAWYSGS